MTERYPNQKSDLLVDGRWTGHYGIARFSGEVISRLSLPFHLVEKGPKPGTPQDVLFLTQALSRSDSRVFWTPGFNGSPVVRMKQILTVHDLIHMDIPEESSRLRVGYYRYIVRPTIHRAGAVLTGSEFAKRSLTNRLDIDPSLISVVGYGSSIGVSSADQIVRSAEPFVLYVGNGKPHKNVRLLLAAMEEIRDLKLVLVGDVAENLREFRPSTDLHERLVLKQSLSDVELGLLYRQAAVLAFPSIYEGFGLPALEAMSCGTETVYCSEAVGEVVGDTGQLVQDRNDPSAFAKALQEAAEGKGSNVVACQQRASLFTWDAVAERVESTLNSVCVN
jgi:glycosyltransferase involved in cell wall biosynthesis